MDACLTSRPRPRPRLLLPAKPSSRGGKEVTLAGLLRKKAVAAPAPAPTPERDELEEYLSAPLETDTNLDLLAYWKLKKGIDVAQARQE